MTIARSAPVVLLGAYEINLNGYANIGTHWIPCFLKANFNSFGVDFIPKEITKFIGNKNIILHIFAIILGNIFEACDSVTCGYFCIATFHRV